jgi:periplasmic nitrate reductase NapD
MTAEHHIASFALRCDPVRLDGVRPLLAARHGVEIAIEDAASGKMVLVMEAPDAGTITRTLAEIQLIPGVASALLVYQHILSPEEMPTEGALA